MWPTAEKLVQNKHIIQAFKDGYKGSFESEGKLLRERGGWIYVDPTDHSRVDVRHAQKDRARPFSGGEIIKHRDGKALQGSQEPKAAINLNDPPGNPGQHTDSTTKWVLVANFHTHPHPQTYELDKLEAPSRADFVNASYRNIPGFVVQSRGIIMYGPESRPCSQSLDEAKPGDYPNNGSEVEVSQLTRRIDRRIEEL